MSDIMEKTIASLPSLISGTLTGKSPSTSRAFQTFVRNLGNLKSKYEEEQFMKRELSFQKQRLVQPSISSTHMREYLVRLVYCSMLGYDVSFAYIHAIKLAQQGTLIDKRAGYLVSAIFLNDSDELVMLLVNTIQKDLRSTNIACICMALTATGQLISQEMIPALLPLVEEKLKHPREVVRKKSVLCLHSLYAKAPELLAHTRHHLRTALCDSDPSVMWAALHFYHQLIQEEPFAYSDLIPSLIGILEQVLNRHLPSDFEYHGIPAPWLQILLLKMLAKLGHNQKNSEPMYAVLSEILQRTEPSHKIGLAVIYECLETILTIWPHPSLVEHAAKVVGKFLSSKSNNLRYLGIKALTLVVCIDAGYAIEHQEAVIDSLEHPDLTIRTKTLELLYQMVNTQNRRVICERLLHHLSTATDGHIKANIINKVINLADKFADDKNWFIAIVNRAIVLGGQSLLPAGTCEKILDILPRGTTDEERGIQKFAAKTYWVVLHHDEIPDVLLQVAAWVLGEYCAQVAELDLSKVVHHLVVLYAKDSTSTNSRLWILSALLKFSCDYDMPREWLDRLYDHVHPEQVELKQRLEELKRLAEWKKKESTTNLNEVIKDNAAERDWSMSFLDDYIAESLEKGAAPYAPVYIRFPQTAPKTKDKSSLFTGLNFNPYESPRVPVAGPASGVLTPGATTTSLYAETRRDLSLNNSEGSIPPAECAVTGLQMSDVKRVWTESGIIPETEKEIELTRSVDVDKPIGAEAENPSPPLQRDASDTSALEMEAERQRRELTSQLFSGISSEMPSNKKVVSYGSDGGFQGGTSTNASIDIAFHTTTAGHAPSITGKAANQDQPKGHYLGQSQSQGHMKGHLEMGQYQKELEAGRSASVPSFGEQPSGGLRLENVSKFWTQDMLDTMATPIGSMHESYINSSKGTHSSGSSNNDSTSSTIVQNNSLSKSMYDNLSPVAEPKDLDLQPNASNKTNNPDTPSSAPSSMYDDFSVADYVDVTRENVEDNLDGETPVMVSPINSPEKHQHSVVRTPEGAGVDLLAAADLLSPDNAKCFPGEEKSCPDGTDFIRIELPKGDEGLSASQLASLNLGPAGCVNTTGDRTRAASTHELKNESIVACSDLDENKITSSSMGWCREDDDGLSIDSLEHEQLDVGEREQQMASDLCGDWLPQAFRGFPHEPAATVGGRTDCLTLLYQKVWLPDKILFVITAFLNSPPKLASLPEVKIEINTDSLAEQGLRYKVLPLDDDEDVYPMLPSHYSQAVLELMHTETLSESPVVFRVNVQQVTMETAGSKEPPPNLTASLQLHLSDFIREIK